MKIGVKFNYDNQHFLGQGVKEEIFEHLIERQMNRFLQLKYENMQKVPRPEKILTKEQVQGESDEDLKPQSKKNQHFI